MEPGRCNFDPIDGVIGIAKPILQYCQYINIAIFIGIVITNIGDLVIWWMFVQTHSHQRMHSCLHFDGGYSGWWIFAFWWWIVDGWCLHFDPIDGDLKGIGDLVDVGFHIYWLCFLKGDITDTDIRVVVTLHHCKHWSTIDCWRALFDQLNLL